MRLARAAPADPASASVPEAPAESSTRSWPMLSDAARSEAARARAPAAAKGSRAAAPRRNHPSGSPPGLPGCAGRNATGLLPETRQYHPRTAASVPHTD